MKTQTIKPICNVSGTFLSIFYFTCTFFLAIANNTQAEEHDLTPYLGPPLEDLINEISGKYIPSEY